MSDILYLASQSKARQKMLNDAGINFKLLDHTSDEGMDSNGLLFHEYVQALACHKMEHVIMPDITQVTDLARGIFIVTADTLMMTTKSKQILGKPKDIEDAKRMLRLERTEPIDVTTGCCLEHRVFIDDCWKTISKKEWSTSTIIEFHVHEDRMNFYLKQAPWAMYACGAGIIEGAGAAFLKRIEGSYSSVLGLPLFELQSYLTEIDFNF